MNDPQNKTELHWVYQSIINWANLSSDRDKLIDIADFGLSTFYFLQGIVDTDDIHAYMGCYKDAFYIHFIPSSIDIAASFTDEMTIPNQLYSCIGTETTSFKGPVFKTEAEERMNNWGDKTIRDSVLMADDLFQIFWIPNEDFEDNTPLKVNLAINNSNPDLILTQISTTDSFLNTCKPIPPFKPTFLHAQFALYEKIQLWNI